MIVQEQDIRSRRQIANNLDPVKLTPFIKEVETAQVRPLLGAKLYKELDEGVKTDDILLDGGYYNNDNNFCEGLKEAVAYLVYARMLPSQQMTVTAYGVVQKTGEFSNKVDEANLNREVQHANQLGEQYLQSCVNYLRWKNEIPCGRQVRRKVKITAL